MLICKLDFYFYFRASNESPATIVTTSSPECDLEDRSENAKYPGLRLISMDEGVSAEEKDRQCDSPVIPVLCPVPVRGKCVEPVSVCKRG